MCTAPRLANASGGIFTLHLQRVELDGDVMLFPDQETRIELAQYTAR
jgi:hypothetical protein